MHAVQSTPRARTDIHTVVMIMVLYPAYGLPLDTVTQLEIKVC